MKTNGRLALAVCLFALAVPVGGEGQVPGMTQAEMATALSSDDPAVRDRAPRRAIELGWRAGPELREAVIRAAWAEVRGETNRPPGEYLLDYHQAVVGLRDPAAIPLLVRIMAVNPGAAITNALADLGADAFPAVLEAANAGEYRQGSPSLSVLRFMVEDGTVSGEDMSKVREVVRTRLTGRQHWHVVLDAIQLAVVLDEPEFLDRVATLAGDRDAVVELLGPLSGFIRKVQGEAKSLLSGDMLPYPQRRPEPGPQGNQ